MSWQTRIEDNLTVLTEASPECSPIRLAKLWELPVLGVLNGLRRRRLHAVVSLDHNRVANMVLFVSEEFALIIDRCHGRDASRTYSVNSCVQSRTMSEFEKWSHVLTGC